MNKFNLTISIICLIIGLFCGLIMGFSIYAPNDSTNDKNTAISGQLTLKDNSSLSAIRPDTVFIDKLVKVPGKTVIVEGGVTVTPAKTDTLIQHDTLITTIDGTTVVKEIVTNTINCKDVDLRYNVLMDKKNKQLNLQFKDINGGDIKGTAIITKKQIYQALPKNTISMTYQTNPLELKHIVGIDYNRDILNLSVGCRISTTVEDYGNVYGGVSVGIRF